MKNNNITKKRNLKDYSQYYLNHKEYIKKWKEENKEHVKEYQTAYQLDYYQKTRDIKKKTFFWGNFKTRLRNFGFLSVEMKQKFLKETGITYEGFCEIHQKNIAKWISSELQVSHIIPKITLHKFGFIEGANHFSNIEFLSEEINKSYYANPTTRDIFPIMKNIVEHTLKVKTTEGEK